MTVTLKASTPQKERQRILEELQTKMQKKKYDARKKIIERTFGSVPFDEKLTPLEIQQQMRDERD